MEDICAQKIQKFENFIEQARRISIVSHMKPDGDAIGSSVALYHYLVSLGKSNVKIILNDRHPAYLDFVSESVPLQDMVIHKEKALEAKTCLNDSDLIFCLDFNAFYRTDNLQSALESSKADKILIDHHLNPDASLFELVFSQTNISSTSELLYNILIETSTIAHNISLLPRMSATALMSGMTTDTNNFANSVYPSTLRMASALLAVGVDRDEIISNLYNKYHEGRLRLMGHILKDLLKITDDGVAYIVLDKKTMIEYGIAEGETEGFVNMPLSIDRVRMSLFLKEDEDRIRVSIRSKKGTSANRCAVLYFNGGGHENASGGKLLVPEHISGIEAVAEYIEKVTHKYFTEDEKNTDSSEHSLDNTRE